MFLSFIQAKQFFVSRFRSDGALRPSAWSAAGLTWCVRFSIVWSFIISELFVPIPSRSRWSTCCKPFFSRENRQPVPTTNRPPNSIVKVQKLNLSASRLLRCFGQCSSSEWQSHQTICLLSYSPRHTTCYQTIWTAIISNRFLLDPASADGSLCIVFFELPSWWNLSFICSIRSTRSTDNDRWLLVRDQP